MKEIQNIEVVRNIYGFLDQRFVNDEKFSVNCFLGQIEVKRIFKQYKELVVYKERNYSNDKYKVNYYFIFKFDDCALIINLDLYQENKKIKMYKEKKIYTLSNFNKEEQKVIDSINSKIDLILKEDKEERLRRIIKL